MKILLRDILEAGLQAIAVVMTDTKVKIQGLSGREQHRHRRHPTTRPRTPPKPVGMPPPCEGYARHAAPLCSAWNVREGVGPPCSCG